MQHKVFGVLNPNLQLQTFLNWLRVFTTQSKLEQDFKQELFELYPNIQSVHYALRARSLVYASLLCLKKEYPKKNEVIIPAYTCKVVVNAVLKAGLKPVFVDLKKNSLQMNQSLASEQINASTLVFFLQHTFGEYQKIEEIESKLKHHKVFIFEDLAHAYYNPKTGEKGDLVLLSFGSNKLFASSYGGALINKTKYRIVTKFKPLPWLINWFSCIRMFMVYLIMRLYRCGIGALMAKFLKYNPRSLQQVSRVEKTSKIKGINYFKLPKIQILTCLQALKQFPRHYHYRKQLFNIYKKSINKNLQVLSHATPQGLFFPVKTKDPKKLAQYLKQHGIYINLSWSFTNFVPKFQNATLDAYSQKCEEARQLALQLVGLPVNLQTRIKDAKKIAQLINKFHEQ